MTNNKVEQNFCRALAEFRAKHRRGAWMYVRVRLNDDARYFRCQQWVRRRPNQARIEFIAWADEFNVLSALREYFPFCPNGTPLSEVGLRNMIVMIAEALATREGDWRLHKACPRKRSEAPAKFVFVVERKAA